MSLVTGGAKATTRNKGKKRRDGETEMERQSDRGEGKPGKDKVQGIEEGNHRMQNSRRTEEGAVTPSGATAFFKMRLG